MVRLPRAIPGFSPYVWSPIDFTRGLIVHGCCSDLAPEDTVADERVEQHQRKDDYTSPEYEHKTGLWRGRLVDGDDERDHVRPERQCESAKCRHEDHCDHVERPTIVLTEDAEREHDCGDPANRREGEEIRPIDPTMQDWEMLGQRVNEDDDEKYQYANRENADLAVRPVANFGVAFVDQPAGAEKCVAKAQADAAEGRKRRKPAEITPGILTVGDLQPLDQGSDRCPLHEARDQGSAGKAQIPDPPHSLRLVAKLESYAAKNKARQNEKERKIEGRQEGGVDEGKGPPQDDAGHHEPGLVAVPDRRNRLQHDATLCLALRQAE